MHEVSHWSKTTVGKFTTKRMKALPKETELSGRVVESEPGLNVENEDWVSESGVQCCNSLRKKVSHALCYTPALQEEDRKRK